MKHLLPSLQESLEMVALVLLVTGLQWWIGSWEWSAFFALGFVWNWSVLNGWVGQQVSQRQYRFSMLKGITKFHELLTSALRERPTMSTIVSVLPAGVAIGAVALLLNSSVPWWAAFLGSGAFILVRRQLAEVIKLPKKRQ